MSTLFLVVLVTAVFADTAPTLKDSPRKPLYMIFARHPGKYVSSLPKDSTISSHMQRFTLQIDYDVDRISVREKRGLRDGMPQYQVGKMTKSKPRLMVQRKKVLQHSLWSTMVLVNWPRCWVK